MKEDDQCEITDEERVALVHNESNEMDPQVSTVESLKNLAKRKS